MGYTTSFRMGQLLEHHLQVPKQKPDQSDMEYMVTQFVECTRELLKKKGFSKIESNSESGGQFLVGYRGNLYSLQKDFQVGAMADELDAVGSGSDFALGAMVALAGQPPTKRIKKALEIAASFHMGVCAPYYIRSMKADGKSG